MLGFGIFYALPNERRNLNGGRIFCATSTCATSTGFAICKPKEAQYRDHNER
jgi:hypothetical protein